MDRMCACGEPEPQVGDGLLCLPTLIHRGPGGKRLDTAGSRSSGRGQRKRGARPGSQPPPRRVLFFTLRPRFTDERARRGAALGTYDADRQVHAAWLLWRTRDLPQSLGIAPVVKRMYKTLGYDLSLYGGDDVDT